MTVFGARGALLFNRGAIMLRSRNGFRFDAPEITGRDLVAVFYMLLVWWLPGFLGWGNGNAIGGVHASLAFDIRFWAKVISDLMVYPIDAGAIANGPPVQPVQSPGRLG